jgi:hypothetical protein
MNKYLINYNNFNINFTIIIKYNFHLFYYSYRLNYFYLLDLFHKLEQIMI